MADELRVLYDGELLFGFVMVVVLWLGIRFGDWPRGGGPRQI